ncbi:CYTH domain-containing protein, partial [Cryobacterium sp. 10I1]|uniref:CYTH domain-containing protein n=1 Tax=Cryobacterium sp. 10I1 TaxID=3048578 RepID=UPI002B2287CC
MNAVDFSEVERKYDVDAASVLPPLHELPGVTWVDAPVDQSLDAVYFDTADLTLAAHRITLRRRTKARIRFAGCVTVAAAMLAMTPV